jgi:hypothetical protein
MADMMAPLIPTVIIFLVIWLATVACVAAIPFLFVSQYWTQLTCNLLRKDILITTTQTDMWIEPGNKEYKTDTMYKESGGMFKKKGPVDHMDDLKYKNNSSIKWGNRCKVLNYYPGKVRPKHPIRMAAQQTVLKVAGLHISKDGQIKEELLSISGQKIGGTKTIKKLFDRIGITKAYYSIDPDDIIKHNEYLCLIVESDPDKALTLIKRFVEGGENVEDEEFKARIDQFVILPSDIKKEDTKKVEGVKDQLVEEIKMISTVCKDILVPPSVVSLAEMMRATPDSETTDEQVAKLKAEMIRKAQAKSGNTELWKVIVGMLLSFIAGAGMIIVAGMVV